MGSPVLLSKHRESRSNLHLAVAGEIGADIVTGRLPVGGLVPSEPELCTRFGVSRTVIREAVKFLSWRGLLKTGSGVGTVVLPTSQWNFLDPVVFGWVQKTSDSQNAIQQLFAFRSAVEPAAAAEAARNATLAQLYEIEAALQVMSEAKTDFNKWIEGDVAFHTAIYVASNNVFIAPLANLFRQYFQMSFSVSSSNFHHQHCLQEHRDVFEAIRERDPEKAAETVRILLKHADEDVKSVLQK
ncbi:FadR/GntR family transcriptional regulator [Rhizobium sp. YAF28]|jgi:DNA-binding FadR family transcriptional regulator|uniref:FadR/GntR family transcriptional regulator n=1 Tax=Rhizobium sp. YAF28 TaxID=3233081 RepID=UPI0013B02A29